MEDRSIVDPLARGLVGESVVVSGNHAPVAHHKCAGPDHAVAVGVRLENASEALPAVRKRWRLSASSLRDDDECGTTHERYPTDRGATSRRTVQVEHGCSKREGP